MKEPAIVHLLTNVYSLELALNEEDIEKVKEVRKKAILPIYQDLTEIENEERFLFNQDDEQSFIFLLKHNATGAYVGTIRIFYVNDKTPIQNIPMQIYGNVQGIEAYVSQHPVYEVSRLALLPHIKGDENISALRLRTYLTMGLMSAIGISMFLYPCKYIFAIMEPPLHRIIKRQGVDFRQVAPSVEYFGQRIPYMIERESLIFEAKEIFAEITKHYLFKLCQTPETFWQFIDNHPYLERSDIQLERICQLFDQYGKKIDLNLLLEQDSNTSTA
jgi:N-acyl amino acid synthase of PEP-CTERM/exosortase system